MHGKVLLFLHGNYICMGINYFSMEIIYACVKELFMHAGRFLFYIYVE